MKKLAKEPLVHFLLLGLLLFVLYAFVKKTDEGDSFRLVVSKSQIEAKKKEWEALNGRKPSKEELRKIVDDYVRQQIFYREALVMGLNENDAVIQQRLAQKLEFLEKDVSEQIELTGDAIRQWYAGHPELYSEPARVAFKHLFFDEDVGKGDVRKQDAPQEAKNVLEKLLSGESKEDETQGDKFVLRSEYPLQSEKEIFRLFGKEFSEALFEFETLKWQGPVRSDYGVHLVKILDKAESTVKDFSEVKDRARQDLLLERQRQANELRYQKLLEKYDVVEQWEEAEKSEEK